MAIGQIKAFMAILQTKIDHHSQLMKSHKERALKYWKDNMKDSARASLSTSKRHQQNVHKCELNYQNLSMHLQLIDDAISNGQILKVYEITTKALNRITTKNEDLSSENIAKILTDFDIAMDDIQEMNDSITGDHSLNQSEMDELNKELQNFELEDTDKIEKVCEKPIDDGLQDSTPTVPSPIQTTATPSIKPRKITAKVARASLVES
ncbi:uncharacterized protein TRIADDRAFT_58634 [Trichoplax adhaerens]|uniref:Uncharacterized protein n=1 Tax=Trichoplax adhaerens TaxID=10228 RepID=B3S387_TRIAD|nr:hypothetical protein TRIADDRAFT_58634 [Trichoplax adhaerens]EDV22747.1 hypothetical protein TRIADDRAFT_58634 [Trichoplax adhaerens]|eukprot:XP_002114613.1 hypothetical protein TRIADDRAFT_58634 [Trichoplax adhaerens]